MRILLLSATIAEIEPFLVRYQAQPSAQLPQETYRLQINNNRITVVITGAGMMHVAYHTSLALFQRPFDIAIQAGIAGSFNPSLALGEVVHIKSEQMADLGVEDHDLFIPITEMPFFEPDKFPYEKGKLLNYTQPEEKLFGLSSIKVVSGITVNTASGNAKTIAQRQHLFSTYVETMEGAAFFYACLMQYTPFCQIRTISNYIEPRNTANWNIPIAIEALSRCLGELFESGKEEEGVLIAQKDNH